MVIPTGAIEQHGHHLPVGGDAILGQAWLNSALEKVGTQAQIWVAPPITYGKSNEHTGFPGTVYISAKTLRRVLLAQARQLKQLGFRNIALLNTLILVGLRCIGGLRSTPPSLKSTPPNSITSSRRRTILSSTLTLLTKRARKMHNSTSKPQASGPKPTPSSPKEEAESISTTSGTVEIQPPLPGFSNQESKSKSSPVIHLSADCFELPMVEGFQRSRQVFLFEF